MVARPSIFSSDYKDKMKRRKVRNIIILLVFVILLATIFLFSKIDFSKITKGLNSPINKQTNGVLSVKTTNTTNDSAIKPSDETDVMGYTVKLSSGQELKAVYEGNNNDKKFKYVSPEIGINLYQISPSGNGIIIYDKASQGMIYVKIDGTILDITEKQYISSDKTVFQRDEELKKNPSYVWCDSPKFIDDENIVYISQLPWFNSNTTKYIWTFNVTKPINSSDSYHVFESLAGDSITIGDVTPDKGISIQYDGNTKFLSADGKITE
jgi:hypothetical protein